MLMVMKYLTAQLDMMNGSRAERMQAYPWNLKPHSKRERISSFKLHLVLFTYFLFLLSSNIIMHIDSFSNCSSNLSFDFKRVALEASTFVVGILACSGETKVVRGSGFVVESIPVDDKFVSTIITSAYVLRPEADIDSVADNIKISVILFNDVTCEGDVFGWDFHYNIGVIKIETNVPIPTARVGHIIESISIDPNLLDRKPPRLHEFNKVNLAPGDTVVALGRYYVEEYGLMVVAGKFSANVTGLDCQELFKAEIVISLHGIGGPLINSDGEVIGVNFYSTHFTPFLPINIVSMWWNRFKNNGHCLLPRIGMVLSNLYLGAAEDLEILLQTFPNTFEGVVVDEIKSECPFELFHAESSSEEAPVESCDGLLPFDVIVGCDGISVRSVLEFFELIWDKVGHPVCLDVLRPTDGSRWDVTVMIGNVGPNEFNRWPIPETRKRARGGWVERLRQARAPQNVT